MTSQLFSSVATFSINNGQNVNPVVEIFLDSKQQFTAVISKIYQGNTVATHHPLQIAGSSNTHLLRERVVWMGQQKSMEFFRSYHVQLPLPKEGGPVILIPKILGGGGCFSQPSVEESLQSCFVESILWTSPLFSLDHSFPLKNVYSVASALKHLPPADERRPFMEGLAKEMMNLFGQQGLQDRLTVEEVSVLAFAESAEISRSLVKLFLRSIRDEELCEMDIIHALHLTIAQAPLGSLDPDDLVRSLKAIVKGLERIHTQDSTSYKIQQTLQLISALIDTMGDANVVDVERVNTHDQCYQILDKLSKKNQLLLSTEAHYAKQALVRVPNDEKKLAQILRLSFEAAQGVISLARAVYAQDPQQLITAYMHFKDAADIQEAQQQWYEEIRLTKILFEMGRFKEAEQFLLHQTKFTREKPFTLSVVQLLWNLIGNHSSLPTQKSALKFLQQMFLSNAHWCQEDEVQREILQRLKACSFHPQQEVKAFAQSLWEEIAIHRLNGPKKAIFDKVCREQLPGSFKRFPYTASSFCKEKLPPLNSLFDRALRNLKALYPNHPALIVMPSTHIPNANSNFVGRDSLLNELERVIPQQRDQATVVRILTGPKNVGKSETAIHFAHKNRDQFSLIWNFRCESEQLFEEDLQTLAKQLQIPWENRRKEEIQLAVFQRLEQRVEDKPWLLVFDHLDHLPQLPSKGGYGVITAANSEIGGNLDLQLEVPPLTTEETLTLAEKIQGESLPIEELDRLRSVLGGSPRLLTLALYHIQSTQESIPEYIEKIQRGSSGVIAPDEDVARIEQEVITQRCDLLFRQNPRAQRVFSICSHLNPKQISIAFVDQYLLIEGVERPHQESIRILRDLEEASLIQLDVEQNAFVILENPLQNPSAQTFLHALVTLFELGRAFQPDEPDTWNKGKEVVFQLQTLQQSRLWEEVEPSLKGKLLCIAGHWLLKVKKDEVEGFKAYKDALSFAQISQDAVTQEICQDRMGSHLLEMGRYAEAENIFQQMLNGQLERNPNEHEKIIPLYHNLVSCFLKLGKIQEALRGRQETLKHQIQLYETENHAEVATTYTRIGTCFFNLQDYEKAAEAHQNSAKILESFPFKNLSKLATSYSNVGVCYLQLSNDEKAVEAFEGAVTILKELYGEEHEETLKCYENIIPCLYRLRKFPELLAICQKIVAATEKLPEVDPSKLIAAYTNLGNTLMNMSQYEEAIGCLNKLLSLQEQTFGKSHEEVGTTYTKLGTCFSNLRRYEEALSALDNAIEILRKQRDKKDLEVADCYGTKAVCLTGLSQHPQALEAYQTAANMRKMMWGEMDPQMFPIYTNLTTYCQNARQWQQALDAYQKAVLLQKAHHDENQESIAQWYERFGENFFIVSAGIGDNEDRLSQFKCGLEAYKTAYAIWKKIRGSGCEEAVRIRQALEANKVYSPALIEECLTELDFDSSTFAFGSKEWEKYIGKVDEDLQPPPNLKELLLGNCPFENGKKIKDTHRLVLVPRTINGKPLTLRYLAEIMGKKGVNFAISGGGKRLDKPVDVSHWVLMTKSIIRNTQNKDVNQQRKALVLPYHLPDVLDAAVVMSATLMRDDTRLYSSFADDSQTDSRGGSRDTISLFAKVLADNDRDLMSAFMGMGRNQSQNNRRELESNYADDEEAQPIYTRCEENCQIGNFSSEGLKIYLNNSISKDSCLGAGALRTLQAGNDQSAMA